MSDNQTTIAALMAAFPQAKIERETLVVYVRALADVPPDELEPVAKSYMIEGAWFPTIADLRRGVIERRLQLPGVDTAWEQALEWAATTPTIRCPNGCDRGLLPGGDPVELDRTLIDPISDEHLRGVLERVADTAAKPTHLCDRCDGAGEIPNPARPILAAPVLRAIDHIGGAAAINSTETLSILRAQFLKAYERTREDTLRNENLASAGVAIETTTKPAIEP